MQNIEMKVEKKKLVIEIDLSKEIGLSQSGKSMNIATSNGSVDIPGFPGHKIGINCYKRAKEK